MGTGDVRRAGENRTWTAHPADQTDPSPHRDRRESRRDGESASNGEFVNTLLTNIPTDKEELNRGRYLLDAVEYPVILKALLDAGADIDTSNDFGKSALMVAVHMNRPDSVRLLLQAGADPNLETTSPQFSCGYSMSRTNRTALMYAAENADIDVIRILVDAGAKLDAKDSEGNGMGYYLSLNPYLTTTQKNMTLPEFLASTKQDSTPAPSFDCTAAKQRIEKLICKNLILAAKIVTWLPPLQPGKIRRNLPITKKRIKWLGLGTVHSIAAQLRMNPELSVASRLKREPEFAIFTIASRSNLSRR